MYTNLGLEYMRRAENALERGRPDYARQHLLVAQTSLSERPCINGEVNGEMQAWEEAVRYFNSALTTYRERGVLLDPISI